VPLQAASASAQTINGDHERRCSRSTATLPSQRWLAHLAKLL
jgi:hypothetical protein